MQNIDKNDKLVKARAVLFNNALHQITALVSSLCMSMSTILSTESPQLVSFRF